ncbi:uncharacterized protein LOC108665750 [Hyalella azteca]|uniref:Uncharacterized protein LOC108665750 n=1 Tax=Hyalella azteca TaxID=294128 RepID=A0A8B7N2F9_HYAAZ|nr:uncharacterized protein LOC108665750 [Hyalella azteca]
MMRVLLALVGLMGCFVTEAVDMPDLRYLKAYFSANCTGPFHEFFDYSPELSIQGIDNSINSILFTGNWILYADNFYNIEGLGGTYGHWFGVNHCSNLVSPIAGAASSLRYAGSPYGIDDVYYNLYDGLGYAGDEFRSNTDAETVGYMDMRTTSININGQSPWTFYTGLQFTGEAVCLYPNYVVADKNIQLRYAGVNTVTYLGIPDNSIRSVAKGCLTDNVYRGARSSVGHGGAEPLEHFNLEHTNLEDNNLEHSNVGDDKLEHTDLELNNLEHTNLEDSNMKRSNMKRSNMEHSNLEHSNLEHDNLEHTNMERHELEQEDGV